MDGTIPRSHWKNQTPIRNPKGKNSEVKNQQRIFLQYLTTFNLIQR